MATSDSGMSDDVRAEVNPTEGDDIRVGGDYDSVADFLADEDARRQTEQPPPLPDRPADGAAKAKWVDYCVALGADRTFLTEDTEHFDADAAGVITEPALTRDQLIELADRLGG